MIHLKKSKLFIIYVLLWLIPVIFIFNKYAYEIYEFNSSMRVFITQGSTKHRTFNEKGLPVSNSPKIGEFVSPFYVVHYAIIYSDNLIETDKFRNKKQYHWRTDPSIEYWNVHPETGDKIKNQESFKNSVDWISNNIKYDNNGNAHLFYSFDWPYKGYPNNTIRAPWWSGLTDAYAIIPLLRAADIYGDEKYAKLANELYLSVTSPYQRGGSQTELDKQIWIEEYLDSQVKNNTELSYVFNGMVYSTYGIKSYEDYNKITDENKLQNKLIYSIFNNTHQFNDHGWSYYDLYGTKNNIKYHKVHAILLDNLIHDFPNELNQLDTRKKQEIHAISNSWNNSIINSGIYYTIYGEKSSIAYYNFTFEILLVLLLPFILLISIKFTKKTSMFKSH